MKRIAILIATTAGPVLVDRITPEPAPQSMICLRRQSEVLPISPDYDDFVRPGSGVIMREFGPYEEGAFRLDVSGPIGTGLSWQLGIFAAHAVFKSDQCELSSLEEADLIVWLSGTVDNDLKIGDVDHMSEKVEASAGMLAEVLARKIPVIFAVGPDNATFLKDHHPPNGIEVAALKNTHDLLTVLGLAKPEVDKQNTTFWAMAGLALAALAVVFLYDWSPAEKSLPALETTTVPTAKPPLSIDVFSERGQNPTYYLGEDLNLQVRLSSPAWVICEYEQVDDQVVRLYPNEQGAQARRLEGGRDHILSARSGGLFRVHLGPPSGVESVTCYASEARLKGNTIPANVASDTMTVTLLPQK